MAKYDFQPVLFVSPVSALEDNKLFDKAYSVVGEERKAKTDRYRFGKDKRLSLGAGVLLKYALSYLGFSQKTDEIIYGENEKPYFKNNGIYFNLSHSGDYAVCAVSPCEIGCDIELIKPVKLNVAEKFFTNNEFKHILSLNTDEEKSDLFYRYWTLKESFMKATGLGMRLSLNSFEILLGDEISVKQSVDGGKYSFKEFDEISGYKCAVCISEYTDDIPLIITDVKDILTGGKI